MDYKISFQNSSAHYIAIECLLLSDGDLTELQFPMWRPGRYELGNFSKNIHGLEFIDDNGKKLAFSKTTKSTWEIQTSQTKKINVRYRYFANELNAGSSFIDELQLYVNPANLLIYSNKQIEKECEVKVIIPEDFKIVCGANVEDNVIRCSSYHELVDSPFIAAANLKKYSYTVRNLTFNLWFQGDFEFNETRVLSDFKKFTTYQLKQFKGFETTTYHFIYQILPIKAYHGVEHSTSTVIALGPGKDLMSKLYDDFLGVSSHELYHVWNVKSIRPQEMMPYDYSQENYTHLGYVAEGVTTYMGDLVLCASQVKDFYWYKKELEILLQRHFDNFGRFNYSVAESSFDTWLDGYSMGAPNRKVSIYNEGALLALVVDALIREGSKNKASLHDAMNTMYLEFGKKGIGYSADDFFRILEETGSIDLSDIRANYYYGTHSYERVLVRALRILGLDIEMERNPVASMDQLGIKTIPVEKHFKIYAVAPGSAAELTGLMINDIIVKVNGKDVKKNLDALLEPLKESEITLNIIRMGRPLSLFVPHTNRSSYPIYKIVKEKIPFNKSKHIFKKWCGYKWDEVNI